MWSGNGVTVDSWVTLDDGCAISCDVVGDEAQFRFAGSGSGELGLVITEAGLENFLRHGSDALREMREAESR